MSQNTRSFVDAEIESLRDSPDQKEVSDIIGHDRQTGTYIALGLLELDEVEESQKWFGAASEEWTFYFRYYKEKKMEQEALPRLGEFKWLELLRGLFTAILSGDRDRLDSTATAALKEVSDPIFDDLNGASANPRISAIRALSVLILGNDPSDHLDRLDERLEHTQRPYSKSYYPTIASVINGIDSANTASVARAIAALDDIHEEFMIDSGIAHFTEEAVNLNASALVVLARQMGLDVRIESEYIPNAVYDDEFYPVG